MPKWRSYPSLEVHAWLVDHDFEKCEDSTCTCKCPRPFQFIRASLEHRIPALEPPAPYDWEAPPLPCHQEALPVPPLPKCPDDLAKQWVQEKVDRVKHIIQPYLPLVPTFLLVCLILVNMVLIVKVTFCS